jgi:hypothetical protein
LKPSRILWLLALIGGFEIGKMPVFALELCFTLAKVYTMPLTKPTPMAETLGNVMGASKKIRPLRATGSLLRAPTIEYVVEDVIRTHQADVYEIKTEDKPEKIMAMIKPLRCSDGKFLTMFSEDQFSKKIEQTRSMGIDRRLL